MANNNNLLFNAALAAFLEGMYTDRLPQSATAADYAPEVTQAVAFATEFDSKIPNDGTISGGAGVTLPPTTAAITAAQAVKTALARSVSYSAASGRFSTGSVAADFSSLATNAAALYTQAIASATLG